MHKPVYPVPSIDAIFEAHQNPMVPLDSTDLDVIAKEEWTSISSARTWEQYKAKQVKSESFVYVIRYADDQPDCIFQLDLPNNAMREHMRFIYQDYADPCDSWVELCWDVLRQGPCHVIQSDAVKHFKGMDLYSLLSSRYYVDVELTDADESCRFHLADMLLSGETGSSPNPGDTVYLEKVAFEEESGYFGRIACQCSDLVWIYEVNKSKGLERLKCKLLPSGRVMPIMSQWVPYKNKQGYAESITGEELFLLVL